MLSLRHNKVKELPIPCLQAWPRLRYVVLSEQGPAPRQPRLTWLAACARLPRYLDVCYNEIARLPPQCGHLVALERLLLSDNKLEALPQEVRAQGRHRCACGVPSTHALLPRCFTHMGWCCRSQAGLLTSLVELRLQNNKLVDLPPSMASCNRLRSLNAGKNEVCGCALTLRCLVRRLPPHITVSPGVPSCPSSQAHCSPV